MKVMTDARAQEWQALAEAASQIATREAHWRAADTPTTRTHVETAWRVYFDRLGPIIGEEVALRYHADWEALMTAQRQLAGFEFAQRDLTEDDLDEADVAIWRGLRLTVIRAGRTFERTEREMLQMLRSAEAAEGWCGAMTDPRAADEEDD